MDQIEKKSKINLKQLDQMQYFQSLFLLICNNQLLSELQIEKVQYELIDLLGKQVDRYTNGESSSVQIEKAQELLQSISFCIGVYLKTFTDFDDIVAILKTEKISALFYQGMDLIATRKEKASELLINLQSHILPVNNYAYQDTIRNGFADFFQKYDIEFGAHDIPGSIDYPLGVPFTHLTGVECVYEYLRRLTFENEFLRHFSSDRIFDLLQGFHKDSKHMLISIFELVLTNALACEIVDIPIKQLDISVSDRDWLKNHFYDSNIDEIVRQLNSALTKISEKLGLSDEIREYSKQILPQLSIRLRHNLNTDTLHEIVISFQEDRPIDYFEEGNVMSNEAIRDLIEELSQIVSIQNRMEKIRESVRSVADLVELLKECFYHEEYEEVFQRLLIEEKDILKKYLLFEAGVEEEEYFEPQYDWQIILFQN